VSESNLKDFARRVERDVAEAVRLLKAAREAAADCRYYHDTEPGAIALDKLEELERDARAISICEETKR
jgi:hypothetical protein